MTNCTTFMNHRAGLDFHRKHLKKPPKFWNQILWTDETKISLYQNGGERRVRRGNEQLMIQNHPSTVQILLDLTESAKIYAVCTYRLIYLYFTSNFIYVAHLKQLKFAKVLYRISKPTLNKYRKVNK